MGLFPFYAWKQERFFEIAKLIDNEFINKEKGFNITRVVGCWLIKTDKCDMCPFIKVFTNDAMTKITSIQVLGHYTDGWQEINPMTKDRINVYLMDHGLNPIS